MFSFIVFLLDYYKYFYLGVLCLASKIFVLSISEELLKYAGFSTDFIHKIQLQSFIIFQYIFNFF